MAEILIKQVRSANGASPQQRDTLRTPPPRADRQDEPCARTPSSCAACCARSSTWSASTDGKAKG